MEKSQIPNLLSEMTAAYPKMSAEFTYRGQDQDRLFDTSSGDNVCPVALPKLPAQRTSS